MTCDCRCCEAGKPCARVLMLSPRDSSAADRLWKLHGSDEPRMFSRVTPIAQQSRKQPPEPTDAVRCRSCGAEYQLFTFLVAFLKEYVVPTPDCPRCQQGNAQVAWSHA